MNKYVDSESDSDDDDDDIDIHEIVRSGTFDDVKEAIAIDRPRLIALKDEFERTAMHYAAELNRIKVAVFLIAKQANVNAKDDKDQTPLHLASKKGFTEMVRTLLEFNADIKLRDKNCRTCLHLAVDDNFLETATILVKRGVDLNAEEYRHGRTALHIAAEKGYSEMVTMLLIRGADMYAAGDQFYSLTPLHLACIQGHTEVTRILVKRGADVAVLSGFHDKNPLHLACEHGHKECVEIILSKNIDLDLCGNHINGATALHICAQLNNLPILQLLVEKGANMEKLGRFLTVGTPLHVACTYGNAHAANLLISLGADMNARDETAHTPLHYACRTYNYDCAFMLVDLEADATARADNGKLAFDYIAIPTIKERMTNLLTEVNRRIEERLEAERAALLAEEERLRLEAERLERLRLAEEERIRQEIMRKAAFTKALRSVADISGELNALIGVAEEFPEQDINVNIICPRTEYKSDSFHYSEENEYDLDSLTGTVHSHTTVGTSYGVYQLINSLYDSSALTRASLRGFADVVHALLQWPGVNINYQESNGNTALHNAALIGNREIVEMLLTAGAKLTIFNHEGKVAANLAKTSYLREVIRNPALMQNRIQYQERVLDHLFLQQKCKQGKAISLAEASTVNTMVEFNPLPIKGNANKTQALISASTGNLANLVASSTVEEDMVASPSRSKSKYYRPPKNNKMDTATARSVGSSPLRSILKRPGNREGAQVAPLLVFTPAHVPPELEHLFPVQSSRSGSSSSGGGQHGMVIPAYALQAQELSSPLLQPASQGTESSHYSPYPTSHVQSEQPAISAVVSKYGPVPSAFGGCTSDFFFLHAVPKRGDYSHGTSAVSSPFLDLLTLQRGYVPSAFDSTADWMEIKDFLWLLGCPYKPTLRDGEESPAQNNQTCQYNTEAESVSTDRRSILYRIAVTMDKIQATFTDSEDQVRQSHSENQSKTPTLSLPESLKLPPIGSGQSGKSQQLPPRAVLPSPVTLLKKALTVETLGNRDCFPDSPLPSPGSALGPNFDWSRIPSNISQSDVLRLVRFAQHCEAYVLQVLQLYAPETVGWPNEMHDSVGGCITENIRYNVQYMRYYQLVTPSIEEQLLTLVDLSYTAVFVDALVNTTAVHRSHHRKVGFITDSDSSNKGEKQDCQPESYTEDHANNSRNTAGHLPDLLHNPPRHWRRAVDAVYEVSEFIKIRSEASYPLDAVRAHLWAHAGRATLQQHRSTLLLQRQTQDGRGLQEGNSTDTPLLLSPTTMLSPTAVSTASPTVAASAHTPLQRWLAKLLLSDYESYFQHQGFRCLGDFVGLTEQDCSDYFPFLKTGDLRRLTRAAPLLTDSDIKNYGIEEC